MALVPVISRLCNPSSEPHKEALEIFLKNRLGEMFQLEYGLLPDAHEKGPLTHGSGLYHAFIRCCEKAGIQTRTIDTGTKRQALARLPYGAIVQPPDHVVEFPARERDCHKSVTIPPRSTAAN